MTVVVAVVVSTTEPNRQAVAAATASTTPRHWSGLADGPCWFKYNVVMKSAYELAMERLQNAAPSVSLTEDQKKQLAEVDSTFKAKVAEREVFLKDQIVKAQGGGKFEEVEELQKQLTSEVRRLQDDCESKKEKLRASFGQAK
jgi:hypothetical protein